MREENIVENVKKIQKIKCVYRKQKNKPVENIKK